MDEQKTTDMPWASGSDEWWRAADNGADAAERQKQTTAAQDFQAHRLWHYINFGQDVGGWVGSVMGGRAIYQVRGRQVDWR